MRSFFFMIVILFAPNMSVGQTYFGSGEMSCIEFIEEHTDKGYNVVINDWINGYFSGRITETQRDLKLVNDLNIPLYDLVLKSCIEEPTLNVRSATDRVYFAIPWYWYNIHHLPWQFLLWKFVRPTCIFWVKLNYHRKLNEMRNRTSGTMTAVICKTRQRCTNECCCLFIASYLFAM